jgi:hypothetical protein
MRPRRRLTAGLALALVILSVETAVVPEGEVAQTPSARTAPGPPTLNHAFSGVNSVQLLWSAASNGGAAISAYRIYRGTQPGGENLVTPVATVGNILSYTDSTASFGFTYYYKVSAVNAVGEGALSGEKSARPAPLRSPERER